MTRKSSWNRQPCKNPFDDRFTRDRFRLSFVTDDDAVPQHVRADAFHVLRRNVTAAVQKRVSTRTEREINRRARRRAVTNKSLESQIVGCGLAMIC